MIQFLTTDNTDTTDFFLCLNPGLFISAIREIRGQSIELDDGVKVNYGKFSDPEVGDILAQVKTNCGTKDED